MEFEPDAATATVRCMDSDTVVRLGNRRSMEENCVSYSIEVSAPGLSARIDNAEAPGWQPPPDLPEFLESLAADFHGWPDNRIWHTLDHDLAIRAEFHSGGHVALTWILDPGQGLPNSWQTTVTTWHEAGEQMTALAADVRAFFDE